MSQDDYDLYSFIEIDPENGKLNYDKDDLHYKTLHDAFAMSGFDINTIETEEQLNHVWSKLEDNVMHIVIARILNRDPNNLEAALLQAVVRDDTAGAARIKDKLIKRRKLGLQIVQDNGD